MNPQITPQVIDSGENGITSILRAVKEAGPEITVLCVSIFAIILIIYWVSKQRADMKDLANSLNTATQAIISLKDEVKFLSTSISELKQFIFNMKGKD